MKKSNVKALIYVEEEKVYKTAQALQLGNLALHRTYSREADAFTGPEYVVTHVPTGLALASGLSYRTSRAVIKALVAASLDDPEVKEKLYPGLNVRVPVIVDHSAGRMISNIIREIRRNETRSA